MKDEIVKILKRYIDTSIAKKNGRFIPINPGVYESEFPLIAGQIIDEVIVKAKKEAFEAGREQHLVNTPITRHHYIDGEHRLIDSKVELERPKYPTFEDYLNSIK